MTKMTRPDDRLGTAGDISRAHLLPFDGDAEFYNHATARIDKEAEELIDHVSYMSVHSTRSYDV